MIGVAKNNRGIRVFDPLSLVNFSTEDIRILYYDDIFYHLEDMEQALKFQRVVHICLAFDIHAGSDWKTNRK
ncbi:hypothetical protein Hanom_Chr09g00863491 [Helianthus anomalus]